jgi:hypothetical protein
MRPTCCTICNTFVYCFCMLFLSLFLPLIAKKFLLFTLSVQICSQCIFASPFATLAGPQTQKIFFPSLASLASLADYFCRGCAREHGLDIFAPAAFLSTHARRQPTTPRPLPRCARSHLCPCFASTPPAAPSLRSLTSVLSLSLFIP